MSNIAEFLQKILSARYGKDVRQSIHDAIEEIDKVADTAQESAAASAEESKQNALSASTNAKETEQFRNEAKQFRDEAYNTTPEGYYELVKNVEDNTVKIDSIIEKAELTIKNTASGESVHLTDPTDNKIVEFSLYGKATQNTESSKNILNPTISNDTYGNIQLTVNSDKSILLNGTSENRYNYSYPISTNIIPTESGGYRLNGSPSDYCSMYIVHSGSEDRAYTDSTKTVRQSLNQGASNKEVYYYLEAGVSYDVRINLPEYGIDLNNITLYPMLRPANTDNTYEPYTGVIPNQDNPQEIKVSGASGSVEVKSRGKNWLKNTAVSATVNGVTFTVNADKSVTVNGTSSGGSSFRLNNSEDLVLEKGKKYVVSNGINIGERPYLTNYVYYKDGSFKTDGFTTADSVRSVLIYDENIEKVTLSRLWVPNGATINNVTVYPMIRLEEDSEEYEPYKETVATTQTPNGLAGIPVGSGGNYTDKSGQQLICDEIVKYTDGTGERIQRIAKTVENGTKKFTKSSVSNPNGTVFLRGISGASTTLLGGMSDKYVVLPKSKVETLKSNELSITVKSDGTTGIYIISETAETADELSTYLADNPFELLYVLEEPIHTPLTAEEIAEIEKLQTFYPVTNFTNDSDCGMKVTYLADSKNYIDNQLAIQAQAQEAAMINMLLLLPEETQAAMIENDTNNLLTESEEL